MRNARYILVRISDSVERDTVTVAKEIEATLGSDDAAAVVLIDGWDPQSNGGAFSTTAQAAARLGL